MGIDEVGRGAVAGPVCVGVAVVSARTSEAIPEGLRDSKLIPAARRDSVAERAASWVDAWAIGASSPAEIDSIGIIGALRLAASRALATLPLVPAAAILDGTHNWLAPTLLDEATLPEFAETVVTPKADAHCAVVAAASVLAKVERDAHMRALEDPGYGFATHKGYLTGAHRVAIERLGPGEQHRKSWRLPL